MTSPHVWRPRAALAAIGMALGLAPAGAGAQMLDPAEPQPDPAQLQPGLAVCYMYDLVRHIFHPFVPFFPPPVFLRVSLALILRQDIVPQP
jgi:hypothetical protein